MKEFIMNLLNITDNNILQRQIDLLNEEQLHGILRAIDTQDFDLTTEQKYKTALFTTYALANIERKKTGKSVVVDEVALQMRYLHSEQLIKTFNVARRSTKRPKTDV